MKVKFKCEYNGKNFFGFQRLLNGKRSVQGVLEDALSACLGGEVKINGSGRTDAGVHAREQVCSFDINHNMLCSTSDKLRDMVNYHLLKNGSTDISVRDFEIMPDDFHARFSVKQKTYLYRVYISRVRSPLRDDFYHQIYAWPDIDKMRSLYSNVKIEIKDDEIWFWVTGKGFQRRQVRLMMGNLLCGRDVAVPAKGLTLWSVEY